MFIRPLFRKSQKSKGKKTAYWALVESYRTPRGPRQRVVADLGQIGDEEILLPKALGVKYAAQGKSKPQFVQTRFTFDENDTTTEPQWVEIDIKNIKVENRKQFGGPWLAMELVKLLQRDTLLERLIPQGEEQVPWNLVSLILVLCRLLNPSSELPIAEHFYRSTALSDLLGIPDDAVYDNRLYRGLDKLLPHKEELEKHMKNRLGTLFELEYDLLLYDVTSTYFEGLAEGIPLWKTLGQMVSGAGLGDEPRRVLEELGKISLVDVVLPTRDGTPIRRRCIAEPTEHQKILLSRLGLNLPKRFKNNFE